MKVAVTCTLGCKENPMVFYANLTHARVELYLAQCPVFCQNTHTFVVDGEAAWRHNL